MSLLAHRCRLSATSPLRAVAALPLLRAAAAPRLWLSSVGEAAALSSPPEHLDERERHVWEKLARELEPTRLEVQDVSGGCGSMYAIEIASGRFKGLTPVKQHRLVNQVLADEIKVWHGMQLRTKVE